MSERTHGSDETQLLHLDEVWEMESAEARARSMGIIARLLARERPEGQPEHRQDQ